MILELSEHDVLRLLVLARKETQHAHNPWRPYWEHLSQNLLQSVEGTFSGDSRPDPNPDDELPE